MAPDVGVQIANEILGALASRPHVNRGVQAAQLIDNAFDQRAAGNLGFHVATMLRGVEGSQQEALKLLANFCDIRDIYRAPKMNISHLFYW